LALLAILAISSCILYSMPQCLKCGAELPVNEEGMAPVLCDRCAGRATRRARVGMNTGTLREFPATTILTGINILVFVLMVLASGTFWAFGGRTLFAFGGNFGPATLTGDYWRLVTAGFVHGGLLHIGFNMWCLWSLGQLSERLFGSWITFAVYMLTGVSGALLSTAVHPTHLEVGASGAVFGIAGAILSGIKFGNVAVSSFQKRQIISSMIFFVIFNLAFGAALPGIDNWCHLGGVISGLIFGVPLAVASATGKKRFEWLTMILAALVLAGIGSRVVQSRAADIRPYLQQTFQNRSPSGVRSVQPLALRASPACPLPGTRSMRFSHNAANLPEEKLQAQVNA
jgi:rhomboid protease GluP